MNRTICGIYAVILFTGSIGLTADDTPCRLEDKTVVKACSKAIENDEKKDKEEKEFHLTSYEHFLLGDLKFLASVGRTNTESRGFDENGQPGLNVEIGETDTNEIGVGYADKP